MQAVISASAAASLGGKVSQVFIPTPEAKSSNIPYEQLYPRSFASPSTYIRFSSTVEDCIGPEYCVDEEDDVFLLNVNHARKDGEPKLTEDLLEEVISFFETATTVLQPAAAIDKPPPPSFELLESRYDDDEVSYISPEGRKWAKEIYNHWQTRRLQKGNQSLLSSLKFETGQETDDADAYVCFRRREVRQARKTRGRDAQVVEKLKKMRRELEEARNLVMAVNQREKLKEQQIVTEREVFKQRSELKRVKIQQGIKDEKDNDLDLLVTQKVCWVVCVRKRLNLLTFDSLPPSPRPVERPEHDQRRCVSIRPDQKGALPRTILCSCQTFKKRRLCKHVASWRIKSGATAIGTTTGSTTPGHRSRRRQRRLQQLDFCQSWRRFSCPHLLPHCIRKLLTSMQRMSR